MSSWRIAVYRGQPIPRLHRAELTRDLLIRDVESGKEIVNEIDIVSFMPIATVSANEIDVGATDSILFVRPGIHGLIFSPDGRELITAHEGDNSIRVWSLETGRTLATLTNRNDTADILGGIALSPDGRILASGDWDGKIRVWDGKPRPREDKVLRLPEDAMYWGLTSAAVPFCLHTNKTISLWNPLSFEEPSERNDVLESERTRSNVGISPKGDRTAYVTKDGLLHFWDFESEREIASAPCPATTRNLRFSPDEKLLVTVAPEAKEYSAPQKLDR